MFFASGVMKGVVDFFAVVAAVIVVIVIIGIVALIKVCSGDGYER